MKTISRRQFLAVVGAAAAVSALSACGASSSSASTASSAGSTATETAGTSSSALNIMLETPVQSLDPQVATDGTSFEVIADFTDGLMQMDADGAAVPACAERYDLSDDGKTYTFHIREDANWANGDPVTAQDFVFGWQRAVDPATASEYSYMLSDIGQVVNAADSCAYDPKKALTYYDTAKQELGADSFAFDMVVDADDAPQKVAQVVKEQLETTLPGLTINLVVEPKKQRVEDMQNGNFELGLTRWGPDYADPMTYLSMWTTGNSNNYGLWSNADYDAIIAECSTGDLCTDPEGRWEAMYDAEKIVMDEAVIYPLYTQCNAEMINPNVTGIEFHPVALNRVYKNAVKAG